MGLSAELARALPRVPRPVTPARKCGLELQADAMAEAFGGIARDTEPPPDLLASLEQKLLRQPEALQGLVRRELKAAPYVIWGSDPRWRSDAEFVGRYLVEVAARWPTGPRRLWRHHVMNFDAGSPATRVLAAWLGDRLAQLPDGLQALSKAYALMEIERAPAVMAGAVLSRGTPSADFEGVGLGADAMRASGLSVETLDAVGRLLSEGSIAERVPDSLRALLAGDPADAITAASCGQPTRDRALRSLVDGLVAWQTRIDPDGQAPEPTLDFLLALNGDPRFARSRWQGRVAPGSIDAAERWLSRKTIDAFFRVVDALRTDRPDMWRERRAFWMSYLPHVARAWLVVGPHAVALAEREGVRFGRFVTGDGTMADHCGLVLQVKSACVLEMNKNGSAIFWHSGAPGLPGPFDETYNRAALRSRRTMQEVFVERHVPGTWQRKFRDRLFQMTGLDVR